MVASLLAFGVIAFVARSQSRRSPIGRSASRSAPLLPASSPRLRPTDVVLETHPVTLPESYITVRDWSVPRRWVLSGYNRADAVALLHEMPGAAELLQCDAEGCKMRPNIDAVLALPRDARSRLYTRLAEMRENPQADDAFHRAAAHGPFSTTPGLTPEAARWIDGFTWDQNGTPSFSDIAAVCTRLQDRDGCNAFVRTMLSRPSTTIRLRVNVPGVIDRAVAEFNPERQSEVRDALTAAAADGAEAVSVTTLMPAWARERLDTYPTPAEDWTNCFWSSLNFLNRAPGVVGSYSDMEAILGSDFERVTGVPRFGDVLLLRNDRDRPLHAATVLLAGYAFTKNGFGHLQAWRIAPITDITTDFPQTATVEYWRPRAAAPPLPPSRLR